MSVESEEILRALDGPGLWALAVLLYGVGDGLTTAVGAHVGEATEVGPVAGLALEQAGVPGLVVLKSAFFLACVGAWSLLSTPGRVAIPLALAVVGGVVTAWNLVVLVA